MTAWALVRRTLPYLWYFVVIPFGFAQGKVTGRVVDLAGAAVSQFPVSITVGRGQFYTITDAKGQYYFSGLPTGPYEIASVVNPSLKVSAYVQESTITAADLVVLPAALVRFLNESLGSAKSVSEFYLGFNSERRKSLLNAYAMTSNVKLGDSSLFSFLVRLIGLDGRIISVVKPNLYAQLKEDSGWEKAVKVPVLPDYYANCSLDGSFQTRTSKPTIHATFFRCKAPQDTDPLVDIHFHRVDLPIGDGKPGRYADVNAVRAMLLKRGIDPLASK
jgi:hypothetical protein